MFILDTHVVLWWLSEPEKLSDAATIAISDSTSVIYLSAAVIWELRLKESLGKLTLPKSFEKALAEQSFEELPVRARHAHAVSNLASIHKDPFDRILIAQAISEGFRLITRDENIRRYDVDCLMA